MKKAIVAVLVAGLLAVTAAAGFAQTPNPASDFKVALTNKGDGVIITGYIGTSAVVVIPEEIEGFPVVELRRGSFDGARITSVVFPPTVTSIGENAFYGSKITSLLLPATVGYVGKDAFVGCYELEKITIANPKIIFDRGSGSSFSTFNRLPKLTTIELPDGMEEIPDYFMEGCKNLTTIRIPDSVKRIGFRAFFRCGLTALSLPEGIIEIGGGAFLENKIISLTLPAGIQKIEAGAFEGNGMTEIIIPESSQRINFGDCFRGNKFTLRTQAQLKARGYQGSF